MENLSEVLVNAMFYIYFVAAAGAAGVLTIAIIGFVIFRRMLQPKQVSKQKRIAAGGKM